MMQISESISRETILLLIFALSGCLMVFAYDLLRIIRSICPHRPWVVATEDILYWLCCVLFVFVLLCQENEGLIRGFIMGSILFGMLVYNYLISPLVVRYTVRGIRFLGRIIGKPLKFCGRLLLRPIRFLSKYIRRAVHNAKKLLKKCYRTIKMVLCKL